MKNILIPLIIFLLFFPFTIYSQVKPEILPEEISSGGNQLVCYCKPGVRFKSRSKGVKIRYSILSGGKFKEQDYQITPPLTQFKNMQYLELGIKVPLINKDDFKLLIDYKHNGEFFRLNNISQSYEGILTGFSEKKLKSNSLGLIIVKPLDEKQYLAFRLRYAVNGNYDGWMNFKHKYAIYKSVVFWGFKKKPDFEWGIGISYSKSFRRNNILPFIVLNKTFNKKWGIESVLPANFYIRRNFGNNKILLGGVELGSRSFRLGTEYSGELLDYTYNHTEINFSINYEHHLISWIWLELKVGHRINLSSDFEGKNELSPSFNVDPSNQFFLQFGIFVSPPNKFNIKNK